jgi:hypothetical protein
MSLLIKNTHAGQNMLELEPIVSPQPTKMPLLSGSGKPTFEAFMYQFERTADRKGWTGETKTCKLLDCLTDSASGQIAEY